MNIGTANVASSRLIVIEKELCGKNKWQLHVNVPSNFHPLNPLGFHNNQKLKSVHLQVK